MDDWEDEQIASLDLTLKDPVKSKWDDEDVDDNDVKESWEDEDEPAPAPVAPAAPAVKPTEKASKKSSDKAADKKGKTIEPVKEEPLDAMAEKLRQQRLVEEADYKSTKELFGGGKDEKNLDTFIPKSESDFLEYAELISHKLRSFEKSFHYIGLLKAVMRLSMTSLKGADAKDIASSVTAIANEKIKAEKDANAGKKKKVESSTEAKDLRIMSNYYDRMAAEMAAKWSNNGTSNSFNNHGSGNQNFSNAKINSGAYSGDRNRYNNSKHYGERVINNSGTFNGNGNGGFIEGGFNSSTSNYYY